MRNRLLQDLRAGADAERMSRKSSPARRNALNFGIGVLLALSAAPFLMRPAAHAGSAQGSGGARPMSWEQLEADAARSYVRTVSPDEPGYALLPARPEAAELPERLRPDRFTAPDRPAR
jgi:hypothetical protein